MYDNKIFSFYDVILYQTPEEQVKYFKKTRYTDFVTKCIPLFTDAILTINFLEPRILLEIEHDKNKKLIIRGSALVKEDTITYEILTEKLSTFISEINTFVEIKTKKEPVKSFVILIEDHKITSNITNPEYLTYKSRLEIACAHQKQDPYNRDKDNKWQIIKEYLQENIPSEFIEKITIERRVITKEVNTIMKSFDTLYLRKNDKEKLKNIVELFHENKDLWEEMGIPNKLGILLYGQAGTGKSSAIATIATYLEKNIYCVDFKTIKTNDDFMSIVNYVNLHCTGGGIVTFEDIDAMSNILHKRTFQSSSTSPSLTDHDNLAVTTTTVNLLNSSTEHLTLDYILNTFQGSLTPNGFIFIATTNHLTELDEALYRDGRFDLKIEMKLCDRYQIQQIFLKLMKRELNQNILERIEEDKFTPANIIFRVIHFARCEHTDENIMQPFLNF